MLVVFVNGTVFSVRYEANGRNMQRRILNIPALSIANVPICDIDFVNLLLNAKER
jgi:hypothetical protein